MTASLARLARSPLSTVAGDGSGPSPQALVQNVGAGIVHTALSIDIPPPIVLQPWEGLSCRDVLTLVGNREPRRVPTQLARAAVNGAFRLRAASATVRRLEVLWFGQRQHVGWLDREGWTAAAGRGAWAALGADLARSARAWADGGSR